MIKTRWFIFGALTSFIVTEGDEIALKELGFPIFSILMILGIFGLFYLERKKLLKQEERKQNKNRN